MYYNKNVFPVLPYCGPHSKLHGTSVLSMNYHLRFVPKLGNGVCAIRLILCDFVACTSLLYKPWIYGIPSNEQERYKPVAKCTYCPVLGSFNNSNILLFPQKPTPSDTFDSIH